MTLSTDIEKGEFVVALAHQLQILCYDVWNAQYPTDGDTSTVLWEEPLQMWLDHLATICVKDLDQNVALTMFKSDGGFTIYISSSHDPVVGHIGNFQDIWHLVQSGPTARNIEELSNFVLSKTEGRIVALMRLALGSLQTMFTDSAPKTAEEAHLIEEAINLIGDESEQTRTIAQAFGFSFAVHPPVAPSYGTWQKLIERYSNNDLIVSVKRPVDALFRLNAAIQGLFEIPDIIRERTLLSVIDTPKLEKQLPNVSLVDRQNCLPSQIAPWPSVRDEDIQEAIAALERNSNVEGKNVQVHPVLALHTYMTMEGLLAPKSDEHWVIGTSDTVCRGCSTFIDAYYAYYHICLKIERSKASFKRNPDPTPFLFPWAFPCKFDTPENEKEIGRRFRVFAKGALENAGKVYVPELEAESVSNSDTEFDSEEEEVQGHRHRRGPRQGRRPRQSQGQEQGGRRGLERRRRRKRRNDLRN